METTIVQSPALTDWEEKLLATLKEDIALNRLILPTLPEVSLRVRELVAQDDCSIADLAELIGRDAGMAARLIKVANSALHRASRPIEDLRTAVTRLGMNLVRSLVTQLALLQSLHCYSDDIKRELREITEHSMEVGATCHALATRYTLLNPEEALLAGLVHDIGKLPVLRRMREIIGPDYLDNPLHMLLLKLHTQVGEMILRQWGFSEEMVAVAREHENLQRNPDGPLDYTDLVIVANLHVHLDHQDHPYTELDRSTIPAIRKLELDPEVMLHNDLILKGQVEKALLRLHL
jgi:putative nucleotidyltransferase with HDIG domain